MQSFFKDFILIAEYNIIFIEQLKATMINEIIEMSNSSFEVQYLPIADDGNQCFKEYIVSPEAITTMRVLAKFLGFVLSRPFEYGGLRNSEVDNRQIQLRNFVSILCVLQKNNIFINCFFLLQIGQTFDIKSLLTKAIRNQKILVVIPWIVQYLSMLDFITLRLDYYKDILEILFELYVMTAEHKLMMRPESVFIIKLCLGWLFEQPNVPDDYFNYRQNRRILFLPNCIQNDFVPLNMVKIYIPDTLLSYFANEKICLKQYEIDSNNSIKCSLEKIQNKINMDKHLELANLKHAKPILENTLNSSCPFLADFRVSIMPTKHSKTVSRTGRYRHITTKISNLNASRTSTTNSQEKLCDAFMHSQSLSLKRTVEFITERTISAVIKDFQVEILLCSKKSALEKINSSKVENIEELTKYMCSTFETAQSGINQKWAEEIPKSIKERAKVKSFFRT